MVSPMPGGNVNYPVTVTLTLNNQVLQSLINPTAKKKTDDSSSKVLKTLYSLEKFASASLRNSDVMKAYTGAMGKTFGAAMNLLLLPFMPLFNLLLLFMNKMIVWLVTSGVLDKMLQASQSIARGVERLFDLWENFSWSKLGSMIWDGIQEVMGNKVGFGALAVGGLALAHMMPFIGPLMMMAEGFLIKRGIGMIIGRGAAAAGAAAAGSTAAGATAAGATAAGATAAGGASATAGAGLAGGGILGVGLSALAVLGGIAIGVGSQVLASSLIPGRTAGARLGRTLASGAGWAAGGAVAGGLIGGPPGAVIGAAIGGGIGLLLQGVGEIKDYMQYGNDSGAQGDQGGQGSYYYKNNSDNTTTTVTNYISPNYSDLQRVMNGLNSSSSGVPLSGGGGGGAW